MKWFRPALFFFLTAVLVTTTFRLSIAEEGTKTGTQKNLKLLNGIPDAVKATILVEILREVDGLELEEIEREREGGKIVYEAEFTYKGKEIELEISASGELLEKEIESDDEDDEDDDSDGEDDD